MYSTCWFWKRCAIFEIYIPFWVTALLHILVGIIKRVVTDDTTVASIMCWCTIFAFIHHWISVKNIGKKLSTLHLCSHSPNFNAKGAKKKQCSHCERNKQYAFTQHWLWCPHFHCLQIQCQFIWIVWIFYTGTPWLV